MSNSTTPIGHQEQCNVDLFKGKGKLCSVFGEPNDNSLICNIYHCNDIVLWNKCHYAEGYKEYNNISLKEWENIIFDNMETKEVKIEIPEGYEIDKENSTFEKIVFKPIVKRWRDNKEHTIKGYYIDALSSIRPMTSAIIHHNTFENRNVFATEKQAESALAMAQISQIMANDERFGGVFDKFDGTNDPCGVRAFAIIRTKYKLKNPEINIIQVSGTDPYCFLTFKEYKYAELFLKENKDLVKDYLMID